MMGLLLDADIATGVRVTSTSLKKIVYGRWQLVPECSLSLLLNVKNRTEALTLTEATFGVVSSHRC
jgi:hypothetical protein